MRKRYQARPANIEVLEQRVMLDAGPRPSRPVHAAPLVDRDGTASRLAVESRRPDGTMASVRRAPVTAQPFTQLNIAGRFNPGAATQVVFADTRTRKVIATEAAASVSAGEVQAVVPIYINPRTLSVGDPGIVSVRVLQDGVRRTRGTPKVAIAGLLLTPAKSPGDYLNTMLGVGGTQSSVAATFTQIDGQGEQKSINVDPSITGLRAVSAQFTAMQQQLAPVMGGQIAQVPLGTYQGIPVVMDRNALIVADSIVGRMFYLPPQSASVHPAATPAVSGVTAQTSSFASSYSALVEKDGELQQALSLGPGTPADLARNAAALSGDAEVLVAMIRGLASLQQGAHARAAPARPGWAPARRVGVSAAAPGPDEASLGAALGVLSVVAGLSAAMLFNQ